MKYWALWFGGSSYSVPHMPSDLETYDELDDIGEELINRYQGHDWKNNVATPAVDRGSRFWVWVTEPASQSDLAYPDKIVGFDDGVVITEDA